MAAVVGDVSGSIAWAAMPANRARARSPRKTVRARVAAGSRADSPKRAINKGCEGKRSGPRTSSKSPCQPSTSGPMSRR